MAKGRPWNREQLFVAFALYQELPFGQFTSRNPRIIEVAQKLDRTPSALSMKLCNIASLDPSIRDTGRSGLTRVSKADKEMWLLMEDDRESFFVSCYEALMKTVSSNTTQINEESEYTGDEISVIKKARIGQRQFRQSVLSAYDFRCCISGLAQTELLIASHIKPWSKTQRHRLNPSNGLCLSNIHDAAFDQGLLTLNEHLEVTLSSQLNLNSLFAQSCFGAFEGKPIQLPQKFAPKEEFLAFHRTQIFLS